MGWSYDAAGNLLNDGSQSYTYDALNRVLSAGNTSHQYNGDGTLVAQTQNSVTTRYTHDLAAPLSQILSDGTQHSVYGMPAERLFAQQNTTKTWYSVDALNSVRALLDAAGIPQDVASGACPERSEGTPGVPPRRRRLRASGSRASCSAGAMSGCGPGGMARGAGALGGGIHGRVILKALKASINISMSRTILLISPIQQGKNGCVSGLPPLLLQTKSCSPISKQR